MSAVVEAALVGVVIYGKRFKVVQTVPERACERFLHSQISDPELRRKLTPTYGFGCKRPSVSNHYYKTFERENTELVTDAIERITPTAIRTVDGVERQIDALVLATGFRVSTDPE